MTAAARRRIEMFDRLMELLGDEVADTLLGQLPPQGQRVATAEQVEDVRRWAEQRFNDLRDEMHHLSDLQTGRMTSRRRRDLLLLATPQFLVLLGIVVSHNV